MRKVTEMPTAKLLPSGAYRVQIYLGKDATGKKQMMSFTAPTKDEAEMMALRYRNEHKGRYGHDMTVKDAIERYISAKTAVLSPSTIRAYRSYQRTHYDSIADKLIFRLTSEDMQLFISSLVGTVSAKTVANVYGLLASAVALFRPDTAFRVTLPRRTRERRKSPSDGLVMTLFEEADSELQKCIALSAFGSLRRGEICALKHRDITGNVVSVHADMVLDQNNEWIYKPFPKTSESIRKVVRPEQVIDLLGDGIDDDFIISISPSRVSDRFIKLRTRLGLPDVRFHDLRHYYASIGAVLGIPDTYLSSFGGWRPDSPIMKNVYQNVIDSEKQKYSDKLISHFDVTMSKNFRVNSV